MLHAVNSIAELSFQQTALNQIAAPLVIKMPHRFNVIAGRPSNEVSVKQLVDMVFSRFDALAAETRDVFNLKFAMLGEQQKRSLLYFEKV